MRKIKRLWDAYRYPGFSPCAWVSGLFGDPHARLLRLKRRGKKPYAEDAALLSEHSTTEKYDKREICPAEAKGFSWNWSPVA
jgi:hypothetical protein